MSKAIHEQADRLLVLVSSRVQADSDLTAINAPALAAAAMDIPVRVVLLGGGVSHGFVQGSEDNRRQWGAVAELAGISLLAEGSAVTRYKAECPEDQAMAPWLEVCDGSLIQTILRDSSPTLHV